jgi:sterol desaturase/sphingolipid hydroxylase (fatty acid hydroxylase superfamily)
MPRAIALATPFFFGLMLLEYLWGRARGRNTYRLNDTIASLSLGVLSQVSNLFTTALRVGIYALAFEHVAVTALPADSALVWLFAVVSYDFCYYWQHRAGHESAIFWAAHVAHHQSQEFNLSTALRQTSTGALTSWIFYLPMAVAGIPPVAFGAAALIDLLYQYWIHTEHIGRLRWLDRVLATPSNHRVHHAINDRYLDRNYGGILILWDRWFGTFTEETERCVYGTRTPLESWDPLWANFSIYAALARQSWSLPRWCDRLLVWIKPPGWEPPARGQRWHPPSLDVAGVRRFDPPVSRAARGVAIAQLAACVIAAVALLWFADGLPSREVLGVSTAITLVLWTTCAIVQGRWPVRIAIASDVAIGVALVALS